MAYVGAFLGTYRLVHRDSNDNTIAELLEKLAAEFGIIVVTSTPNTDMQKMPKVKKNLSTIMKEDDKLVLMGKPNYAATFDVDQFTWDIQIPVTFKNIRSGVVYEKTLEAADFTDLILAAGDQTAAAGQWYNLLTYTVPAQSQMKLGHTVQDVRVDSALNLAWDTNKA